MSTLPEDDIALAAEYVLHLLDPADEAVAVARLATDRAFADEVAAWELRLQPMLDGPDVSPPDTMWQGILAMLPHDSGQDNGRGSARFWQAIAGFSSVAAVVLAVLLWQQPAPVGPPTIVEQPTMVAALGSETGAASVTASYDSANGEMLLTPVALDTGELYPELWVIPADGIARSLGMIKADAPSMMAVKDNMRSYLAEGATLAITPEPETGGPGGKPTGPVIASGKVVTI